MKRPPPTIDNRDLETVVVMPPEGWRLMDVNLKTGAVRYAQLKIGPLSPRTKRFFARLEKARRELPAAKPKKKGGK